MQTLASTETLYGVAGTASAITYTLSGDEKNGIVDTFKGVLAQGVLPTSIAGIYTPATPAALIQRIMLCNVTASPVTVTMAMNGTAAGNRLRSFTIPGLGFAEEAADGWKVCDAFGAVLTTFAPLTATGDATGTQSGSNLPLVLATVNANVGSFGSASAVAGFTVNAKGLTTAASNTPIQIAESQVTNLVSDLTAKVPTSRLINTTAPLTGGGDLTADRTIAMPAAAAPSTNGYMLGVDKAYLANQQLALVNILDYGADKTGVVSILTALNNAVASFGGNGGVVMFPPGVYLETSAPYVLSANNVKIWAPAGNNATILKTTNTTGDQLRLSGYGCSIEGINIQGPGTGTTSNKTAGIGLDVQSQEGRVSGCSFAYHFDTVRIGGGLVDVDDVWCRYFKANGIVVDHNSDHRITRVSMVNNAATLNTNAGIDVRVTASLVLEQLNIIASNWALNLSPTSGTVPSIKATDCFFDTSAIGVRMAGAGSVFRSEFTNCWFSSMSQYGVLMAPSTAGVNVDGLTFVNCDIYNNVAGTTVGVAVTTANVGKWKMVGCSIAGWTDGIAIVGGAGHYPTIIGNTIGAVSAFGVNGTGIRVAAGAYKGLVIMGNDCNDNTAALNLGAATFTVPANYRIVDNPGINPRGAVTPPIAVPVTATTYTNNTGFRCNVSCRGVTMTAGPTVNGVAAVGAGVANAWVPVTLEPGATIALAGTTLTWAWAGM